MSSETGKCSFVYPTIDHRAPSDVIEFGCCIFFGDQKKVLKLFRFADISFMVHSPQNMWALHFLKQESIPVGCVPPAWKPYMDHHQIH